MRYKTELMSKIRLFCKETLEEKKHIHLLGDDFHYLINVMRCEVGSEILLFNENNGEYSAKIIDKKKKSLILEVINRIRYEKILNRFNLIFCPPKSQKLDTLVQKCTEIGVNNFIPVISDHTENRKLNINRLKKIIKEAVEQSNQIYIPEFYSPISFSELIKKYERSSSNIFFADIQSDISFSNLKIDTTKSNSVFIGPEGDFSTGEIDILRNRDNFFSFSLGKRILRSETAAIASLVLLNNLNN
jgi:16S rRNA (uracil1498-N3)-methyltransferase